MGAKNRAILAKMSQAIERDYYLFEIVPGFQVPTQHAQQLLDIATYEGVNVSSSIEFNVAHFLRVALEDWLQRRTNAALTTNSRN